jgi:uncharacterized protein
MRARLLRGGEQQTYAVVFDPGDEFIAGLTRFATEHRLGGAQLTAIGGFSAATLGYFDRDRKDYLKIPVQEQVEVLSLLGDITFEDDKPLVHAHAVVGARDGSTRGGHVLEGHVWPTLVVVVTESPAHLRRRHDPALGLALIRV